MLIASWNIWQYWSCIITEKLISVVRYLADIFKDVANFRLNCSLSYIKFQKLIAYQNVENSKYMYIFLLLKNHKYPIMDSNKRCFFAPKINHMNLSSCKADNLLLLNELQLYVLNWVAGMINQMVMSEIWK